MSALITLRPSCTGSIYHTARVSPLWPACAAHAWPSSAPTCRYTTRLPYHADVSPHDDGAARALAFCRTQVASCRTFCPYRIQRHLPACRRRRWRWNCHQQTSSNANVIPTRRAPLCSRTATSAWPGAARVQPHLPTMQHLFMLPPPYRSPFRGAVSLSIFMPLDTHFFCQPRCAYTRGGDTAYTVALCGSLVVGI